VHLPQTRRAPPGAARGGARRCDCAGAVERLSRSHPVPPPDSVQPSALMRVHDRLPAAMPDTEPAPRQRLTPVRMRAVSPRPRLRRSVGARVDARAGKQRRGRHGMVKARVLGSMPKYGNAKRAAALTSTWRVDGRRRSRANPCTAGLPEEGRDSRCTELSTVFRSSVNPSPGVGSPKRAASHRPRLRRACADDSPRPRGR
jgi:hypothetical protein